MVCRDGKVHYSVGSLFLYTIPRSGRLAEIKWSVCISKFQRSWCVSFSRTDSGLCIYHWFEGSNFNFWHSSQQITFPVQLCLVLYSFCANLLHSLITWLIVSALSPHNLLLLLLEQCTSWLSLSLSLSLKHTQVRVDRVSLLDGIQCLQRADECKFFQFGQH